MSEPKPTFKTGTESDNKIPVLERVAFQRSLIQLMLGEKPINKTDKEWREEALKLVNTHAEKISDIIDDPKNKEIRDFIMQGEYQEASKLVIKILRASESEIAA